MPLPSEEVTPPVTNTNFGTAWTSGVFLILRRVDAERKARQVPGRLVQPSPEIWRHERLTRVRDRTVLIAEAAQHGARAAAHVVDETADDHVGARRHVALEPFLGARARDVPALATLRDDSL